MRLRIPIFIFTLGTLSGIVQLIQNKYTFSKTESYVESVMFFLIIGVIIYICERTGINYKKVNLSLGLLLIVAGFIIDLIT